VGLEEALAMKMSTAAAAAADAAAVSEQDKGCNRTHCCRRLLLQVHGRR